MLLLLLKEGGAQIRLLAQLFSINARLVQHIVIIIKLRSGKNESAPPLISGKGETLETKEARPLQRMDNDMSTCNLKKHVLQL